VLLWRGEGCDAEVDRRAHLLSRNAAGIGFRRHDTPFYAVTIRSDGRPGNPSAAPARISLVMAQLSRSAQREFGLRGGLALPGRAEDAVQEAFAAVWRSAASCRPERGRAASWLFRVAHNAVIDAHRARGRDRADPVGDPLEIPAADAGPDESAEQEWVSFCVHSAVAELPERERIPLELAYWHGRSQSEIARELDLPIGTVKTRTRNGLARLAARLEGTL